MNYMVNLVDLFYTS